MEKCGRWASYSSAMRYNFLAGWWRTSWGSFDKKEKRGQGEGGHQRGGGVDHLTLQSNEKVQECEDFLVETVTERLELVSTVTPSR